MLTVEDGLREGGAGAGIADAVEGPPVKVLGVPLGYIAHGKPDAILADLGLDAAGIAASARALRQPPTLAG